MTRLKIFPGIPPFFTSSDTLQWFLQIFSSGCELWSICCFHLRPLVGGWQQVRQELLHTNSVRLNEVLLHSKGTPSLVCEVLHPSLVPDWQSSTIQHYVVWNSDWLGLRLIQDSEVDLQFLPHLAVLNEHLRYVVLTVVLRWHLTYIRPRQNFPPSPAYCLGPISAPFFCRRDSY